MNKTKFRFNIDFLIICLIGLHVFFWFEDDLLYIGGDSGIPLNPIKNLQHFFTWQVQQGGTESWNMTTCFPYLFFALFEFLGCSLPIIQRLYIYFTYTFAGLSMYYLATTFAEDRKRMVGLVAGLFYMFNPFVLGMTLVYVYLPYAVMPLIVALFCRGLTGRMGRIKSTIFIFLALFGVIGDLPNYKNYAMAIGLMSLCSIYYLTLGEVKLKALIKYLGTLGLLLFLLSLWFILPFGSFLSYTSIGEKLSQHAIYFGDYGYATVANLLRLLGSAAFHAGGATYGRAYTDNPFLVLIGYSIPVLAFLSIILKPRSRNVLLFSIISMVFIFLAKGTNPPFGEVYKWVILHVPLARAFRTSWSLSLGISIGYAFLIGTTTAGLFDRLNNSRPYLAKMVVGAIVLVILTYSWPLVTGTYLETIYNPPDYKGVQVPPAYYEMENFISSDPEDFRILKIPVTGGYITTNWGYHGSNIMLYILSKPFIDSYILPTSSSQICKFLFDLIEKEDLVHLDKFLRLLNIKYILIDGYDKTSIYNRNLMKYINMFSSQPNLRLAKKIDRMYLFENTSRLSHIYPAVNPVIVKGAIDSLVPLADNGYINDSPGILFTEQGRGYENYPVDKARELIFCNQQMIDLICDLIRPEYYYAPHSPAFSIKESSIYSMWLNNEGMGVKTSIEEIAIDGDRMADRLTAGIYDQEGMYSSSGEKWTYLGDTFLSDGEHRLALLGEVQSNGIGSGLLIIPKDEFKRRTDEINLEINNFGLKTAYLFSKDNHSDIPDKKPIINSHVYVNSASHNKVRMKLLPLTLNEDNCFYRDNLGSEIELKKWSFNKCTMGLEPVLASLDKGMLILLNLNARDVQVDLDLRVGSWHGGDGEIKALLNGSLIDKDKIFAYLPEVVFKGLRLSPGKNIIIIGDIPISNDFQIEIIPDAMPLERFTIYDSRYSYSNSEENGLVVNMEYNSGSEREELITLLKKTGTVDLSEFQLFSLTAGVEEPTIQGIEVIASIDYSGDGVIDGFINLPLSLPYARFGTFRLNLYEAAQQRFPYKGSYSLCELGLILHKRWGKNCSGDKGRNYQFYLKDFSLYSEKAVTLSGWDSNSRLTVPKLESNDIEYNSLLLDDGRLAISTYFAGNGLSLGKTDEEGEEKKSRVFVLQGGNKLTGDISEEDASMVRLKGAKELDNIPVMIRKDKVSYEYESDIDRDMWGEIIGKGLIDSDRNVKVTYVPGNVNINEYPYLKVIYKVDDPYFQSIDCEIGLDVTNDGIEDLAVSVRESLSLDNWSWFGSSTTMDFYRTELHGEFPQDYIATNLSQSEFVVCRNGEPVKNRAGDWEDGKVMVDVGRGMAGEIVVSLPKGDSPVQDKWTIDYLPLPIPSKQFPGYMEFNANIKDIVRRDSPKTGTVPTEKGLDRLSIYLKHKAFVQSGTKANYNFDIRSIALYKKSTPSIISILKDKDVIKIMPLFKIDGKRFLYQDTRISHGDTGNDLWVETGAIELARGNHTISPLFNNTFDIKEMVIEPYTKESHPAEAKIPDFKVKRINPTRYIVRGDFYHPFLLVFSDSFHKLWRAHCKVLLSEEKPDTLRYGKKTIELTRHYIVNGYANGWWVDTDELKSLNPDAKGFEIILEYEPQRFFKIGMAVSLLTLILCILYVIFIEKKRRGLREVV